jgi:hypothetical protein
MQHRRRLQIRLLALAGMAILFTSLSGRAAPPEHITIDDCVNKKSAVEFPHAAHFDKMECSTCHHTQENLTKDSTEEVKPCSECHNEPEKKSTPSCSQTSLKKNQFHINCVACHKEEKAGPTKCNDCHPKE